MKHRGVLILILSTFMLSSFSQVSLEKQRNMWETANLHKIKIDYFPQGGLGQHVWDFSLIKICDKSVEIQSYQKEGDGFYAISIDKVKSFILKNDTLYHVKTESPLSIIHYSKPISRLVFPFVYGDSITIPFAGEGIYCDDHIYKEDGQVTLQADAYGKVIIPSGDTLHNVLRVYTLRSYSIRMATDPVAIDTAQLRQIIEEHYEWYARGYRYPIFETHTSTSYDNLKILGTRQVAYCYFPNFLNQLSDPKNRDVFRRDSMTQERRQRIFHYQVGIQKGIVNINYSICEKANIMMLISSTMGIVYYQRRYEQPAGQGDQVQIDCTGLRRGQYILYINVNGKIYSKTITI